VNHTTGADRQKEGRKRKAKKKSESLNSNVGVLERVYWVWGEPEKSIGSVMEGLKKAKIKPEQGPIYVYVLSLLMRLQC